MCDEQRGLDRFARDFTIGFIMMTLLALFVVAAMIARALGYAVTEVWMMNIAFTTVATILVLAIHAILSLRPRLKWDPVPMKYRIALIVSNIIVPALFVSLVQLYGVNSIGSVVLVPIPVLVTILVMACHTPQPEDDDTGDIHR